MVRPSKTAAALIASVLAVVAAWFVLGASAAQAASGSVTPTAEQQFIDAVNRERAAHGAPGVALDAELTDIARDWAHHLAAEERLSHNPDYPNQVSQEWEKLAENVGTGHSVDAIHQAFMGSTTHRANILDPELTHVGLGVVDAAGQLWVTQDFMRLPAAPAASSPSPAPATEPAPAPAPAPEPAREPEPSPPPAPVAAAAAPVEETATPAPTPAPAAVAPRLTVADVLAAQPDLRSWAWATPPGDGTAVVAAAAAGPQEAASISAPVDVPVLPVGVVGAIALAAVMTAAAAELYARQRQPGYVTG